MNNSMFREEQPLGWMFGGSMLGTVAVGLMLAGMALYHFRSPSVPAPAKTVAVKSVWDGVWRTEKYPLPMFELWQAGDSMVGKFVPNWSRVHPFQDGRIVGNSVKFSVADEIVRAHYRMTMFGPDMAKVEGWNTDKDVLLAIEKANKLRLTPQQALVVRMVLEEAAQWSGKPRSLGLFFRGRSDVRPELGQIAYPRWHSKGR